MTAQELKQTLRSEIERRMEKHYDCLPDADSPEDDWTHNELCELGAYKELEHLDTFLDSLPDEYRDFNKLYEKIAESEWFKIIYHGNSLGGDDELKPEWSDEYNEEDLQTRFAFYTYKDGPEVLFLSNLFVEESSRNQGLGTRILSAAEKVAETIGTSSIMLQSKLGTPAIRLYCKNGFELITEQGGYGWFEKKVKEPKEQNPSDIAPNRFNGITYGMQGHSTEKQEWSEENEDFINMLILHFNSLIGKGGDSVETYKSYREKLKSLRPHPHKWYIKKGHWYMCIVDKPEYGWTKGEVYQSPEDNRIETNHKGSLTNWPNSEPWFRPATCDEIPDNQPHWKPSEEQMEALEVGFKVFPKGAKYRESLENLYEQLKMI